MTALSTPVEFSHQTTPSQPTYGPNRSSHIKMSWHRRVVFEKYLQTDIFGVPAIFSRWACVSSRVLSTICIKLPHTNPLLDYTERANESNSVVEGQLHSICPENLHFAVFGGSGPILEYKSNEFSSSLDIWHRATPRQSTHEPYKWISWIKVRGGKLTLHDLPRKPHFEPHMFFLPNFDDKSGEFSTCCRKSVRSTSMEPTR